MDQNSTPDAVPGAQPPADPASSRAPAWNQPEQAAQDPTLGGQAATGAGQDSNAEYAAWSADAAYQQQRAQQAQQQAYAAPEPQSATYTDPSAPAPVDQQAYAQQQAYDQQAYAQQQQQAYAQQQQQYAQQYGQPGYDQQAYAQQQQAYDQQAYAQQQAYQQQYAQQQYAQPGYDQQAYAQQQYGQPGYDPQAYPQQYGQPGYDQQAYAQQAYAQQQYAQQQYAQQQQPGQPYAYAQPGQWPGQEQYWETGSTGYGRSFLAVLAGFVLLTWGVAFGMGGALVLYLGRLTEITQDITLSAEVQQLVTDFDKQSTAIGGILLILGLMQLIGAVGIWAHRNWGRAFGIVLGLLGSIWGLAILVAAVGFEALDSSLEVAIKGEETSTAGGFLVLVTYLLVLVAMLIGRRHFRKKGVA